MTEKEGLYLRSAIELLLNDPGYMTDVEKSCRRILKDQSSALLEDSIHDGVNRALTFSEKMLALQSVKDIPAWLFEIFRNAARDNLRKFLRTRHTHTEISKLENVMVYNTSSSDSKIDIESSYKRAMILLPDSEVNRRRRKVLSYVVQGMKTGEIAKILKISDSIVSKDVTNLRIQIECIERAYQKLLKILSNRQREILEYAINGKRGFEIAELLAISDALVTKELKFIRERLKALLSGPEDDNPGGGRGDTSGRNKTRHDQCVGLPDNSVSDNKTFIASLLTLPAFREACRSVETGAGLSQQRSWRFSLARLTEFLLALPALGISEFADQAMDISIGKKAVVPNRREVMAHFPAAIYWFGMTGPAALLYEKIREYRKATFRIMIAGNMHAGKSTMLNSLVGKDLLPSSEPPSNALLVKISHSSPGVCSSGGGTHGSGVDIDADDCGARAARETLLVLSDSARAGSRATIYAGSSRYGGSGDIDYGGIDINADDCGARAARETLLVLSGSARAGSRAAIYAGSSRYGGSGDIDYGGVDIDADDYGARAARETMSRLIRTDGNAVIGSCSSNTTDRKRQQELITKEKPFVASLLKLPAFQETEEQEIEVYHRKNCGGKEINTQQLAQYLLELPAFSNLRLEDQD